MKLYEFFGSPTNTDKQPENNNEISGKPKQDEQALADEVFWYMLDDDDFHKEFFLPLAHEILALQKSKKFNHGEYIKKWMPLVNKACIQYYHEEEMDGDPEDVFSKEFRTGLCQRLADQHHKDIENGEYKLG